MHRTLLRSLAFVGVLAASTACDTVQQLAASMPQGQVPLTQSEAIAGLKEALTVGISNGAGSLGAADGYLGNALVKIAFPPEAQKAQDFLLKNGGSLGRQLVEDVVTKMNRAAEQAARNPRTKEIFVDAIRGLTIEDGLNIVRGDSTAATRLLKSRTFAPLRDTFSPVIRTEMNNAGVQQAWQNLASKYNQLSRLVPGQQPVQEDISNYVTERALDGLFAVVAKEETNIRQNPAARVTDLLRRVFGSR